MFRRIFISYLAVLLISFSVFSLAFSLTVRHYLINDTVRSLYRVAETLSTTAFKPGMPGSGHMRGAYFSLANRIAYADYILVYPDGTIIESSDIEAYPPGVKMLNEAFMDLAFGQKNSGSLVERDRVAVVFPVLIARERSEAALILYSRLDVLAGLNRSIMQIMALALAAGIIVSLLAGALATRVVVGPLQQLKKRAGELAGRRFSGKLEIKTGDEIEELAHTFNEMSARLAEYDRAQKDFFQKTSHELKTPLMSIQGYAEALRDGIIPLEEKEGILDVIIRESQRMKTLVDEYLYLSKMETLKENYKFEPLDLGEAISEAVYAVRSLALEKGVEIETGPAIGPSIISADPEKIHRLFLNILGNALRHAQKKVKVSVSGKTIAIEDDGPGFETAERPERPAPVCLPGEASSGLGLAISRAIVENHGGELILGNKPGGGARVRISFH